MKGKILSLAALVVAATGAAIWASGFRSQPPAPPPVAAEAPAAVTDSFEARAQKVLKMPPGDLKETSMSLLAGKWAEAAPEQALAFRPTLSKSPKLRQAFDKTAMPFLCKAAPLEVLKDIRNGVWWQDQWHAEHDALDTLSKGPKPVLAWQYVAETQDKQRAWNLASWVGLQKGKAGACLEYLWKQNGGHSSKLVEAALAEWMKNRTQEAAVWLDVQTGELKTVGITQMVQALLPAHPQEALEWAVLEQQEGLRKLHVTRVSKAVRGNEATINSLANWLDATALGNAEKSQLAALLKVGP